MTPNGFDRYMLVVGSGRNRKFVRFTDGERCAHFLGVLSIAAQSEPRGYLLIAEGHEAGAEEVSNEAGVPIRVARSALAKLQRLEVLERDDEVGAWHVHDWEKINPPPRTDPTGAERQARHRYRNGPRNGVRNGKSNGERNAPAVTNPVTVTHTEVEVEVEELRRTTSSSSRHAADDPKATADDRRLCGLMRQLAEERNPKFKVRSRSRWLTDMRLLRDRDGNSPQDIERVLRWVFRDDFWGGVIQSPGNLRDNFARIWDRMERPGNVVALGARRQGGRRETASDWLREDMAPIADAQVVTDEEEAAS